MMACRAATYVGLTGYRWKPNSSQKARNHEVDVDIASITFSFDPDVMHGGDAFDGKSRPS